MTERENTGGGFFTIIAVADNAPIADTLRNGITLPPPAVPPPWLVPGGHLIRHGGPPNMACEMQAVLISSNSCALRLMS